MVQYQDCTPEILALKALEVLQTSIMIADKRLNIVYINSALRTIIEREENGLKAKFAGFDAAKIIGSNIDIFHDSSISPLEFLVAPGQSHSATLKLGSRLFRIQVTPIVRDGDTAGFVVEWNTNAEYPSDKIVAERSRSSKVNSPHLRLAIEYIESNLSAALTLANIAEFVGIGARSLQLKFKKERGQTPVQFIIEQRLRRAHADLITTSGSKRPVSEIARSWGFLHMGDFGKRYRRLFGCTPSQTRLDALKGRLKAKE